MNWRSESLVVFLLALTLYLAGAMVLVYALDIFVTDAMARALDAQQVFFSANPTLASIGFVWPPLPTILQVPLVLLPPLRHLGISANVLTALMGAGAAVVMSRLLRELDVRRFTRYVLLAGLVLNPMMIFYAINGMSEMTFTFLILLTFFHLVRWQRRQYGVGDLMLIGIYAGLASLARYDTVVHLVLLVPVLGGLSLWSRTAGGTGRAWATFWTYAYPAAFIPGLWLWFNFLIKGDPLHFARGEYSNAAQIDYQIAIVPELLLSKGNVVTSADIIIQSIWSLFPPFWPVLGAMVVYALVRRSALAGSLALLTASFPAFQFLNLYAGQSAGFLRYFILAIPYGVMLLGYLVAHIPREKRRLQAPLLGLVVVIMTLGAYSSFETMRRGVDWGQWNDIFLEAVIAWRPAHTWDTEREIADYLMDNTSGRGVLVDDFQGYRIVFFSGEPGRFITNADEDFEEVLMEPWNGAEYVLVPPLRLEGALNRVNLVHPGLYEYGAPWAELEREWDAVGFEWRLYRVVPLPELGALEESVRR